MEKLNFSLSYFSINLSKHNFSIFPGNSQYNDRLEDIKLLKIEIQNMRSQRNLLARGISNTVDMRQEVLQLNRVIVQERVRAKALETEMTTPMNVHRWRKLDGIDPEKAQLMTKIQTLQKCVLLISANHDGPTLF